MIDRLKNKKSRENRPLIAATLFTTVAIAMSGCHKKDQPAATTQKPDLKADSPSALKQFTQDAIKHHAKFLIGACVAWPNQQDGMTVVLNPGIAESENEAPFFVFTQKYKYAPKKEIILTAHGPSIDDPNNLPLAYRPKVKVTGGADREIAKGLGHFHNGQLSYLDAQSGLPLANTAIIKHTPLIPEIAEFTCDALQKDEMIPKVGKIKKLSTGVQGKIS